MNDHIRTSPPVLKEFLIYMENIKGISQKTVSEYYFDLRMFFRFIKKQKKLSNADRFEFDELPFDEVDISVIRDITLLDLYEFLDFLNSIRHLSARSRARKIASLRSFFKYLTAKAKLLETNPAENLDSPKLKKALPIHLSLDESVDLLDSIMDSVNKERDYAILTLFLNCGMRLSELVGINISDIRDDTLKVTGKGNKERIIYLNNACISALQSYLAVRPPVAGAQDKNALFISRNKRRISPKTVQWLVKKYIRLAGLDPEKYSTHKLRHTAATLMYRYGQVDIRALQEILGHEHLSTTEIYTHVDNENLRNAAHANPLSTVTKK